MGTFSSNAAPNDPGLRFIIFKLGGVPCNGASANCRWCLIHHAICGDRRSYWLFALFAVLAVAWSSPVPASASNGGSASEKIDAYLSELSQLGRFNGVVLLAAGGRVVLRKAYGYADFDSRTLNAPATQFEIASLSKMFTAAAILKLSDSRKLQLDDSICKYLDPCPAAWNPITISEVIHHKSGIPDYEAVLDITSPEYLTFMSGAGSGERILRSEESRSLDFPPGTGFNYSNTGYVALAKVIEKASGESYGAYLHAALLDPAGLKDTGVIGFDVPKHLAAPFKKDGLDWSQRFAGVHLIDVGPERLPQLDFSSPHGDASIFSTVDDLLLWTVVEGGSDVITASDSAQIFDGGSDGYGFGWEVGQVNGVRRFRHTGELPGYLSNVSVFPDLHSTLIVLTNFDLPMQNSMRDLTAIVIGQSYDMPQSGALTTLEPQSAARLLGTYVLDTGEVLTVSQSPTMLSASIKGRYSAGLLPITQTTFFMPLANGIVTFGGDARALAQTINLHYDGVDHRGARRIPDPASSPPQRAPGASDEYRACNANGDRRSL